MKQFTSAHPNIHVEIMEVAGSFYQKMLVTMAAPNVPELVGMGQGFHTLADCGVFLDVTDRAGDVKSDAFASGAGRSNGITAITDNTATQTKDLFVFSGCTIQFQGSFGVRWTLVMPLRSS